MLRGEVNREIELQRSQNKKDIQGKVREIDQQLACVKSQIDFLNAKKKLITDE